MAESEKMLDENEAKRRHESTRPQVRSGKGRYQKRMQHEPESEPGKQIKRPKTGLRTTDRPNSRLLNRVAGHVIHGHLQSIANELEISRGRYSHAVAESSCAKTQIYKVDFRNRFFEQICHFGHFFNLLYKDQAEVKNLFSVFLYIYIPLKLI